MDEPYLICHLVRGEPAFDIAIRHWIGDEEGWIIPTSGHRAFPFYSIPLKECVDMYYQDGDVDRPMMAPSGWPDHYPTPTATRALGLDSILGLAPPKAIITRR